MIRKIPPGVWIGLLTAIAIDTAVQLTWKSSTGHVSVSTGNTLAFLLALLRQPLFQITLALWVAQLTNWMLVLSRADVSFAQPMTALSYITVTIASRIILHERITPIAALGTVLIVIGAWQLGSTGHSTRIVDSQPPVSA